MSPELSFTQVSLSGCTPRLEASAAHMTTILISYWPATTGFCGDVQAVPRMWICLGLITGSGYLMVRTPKLVTVNITMSSTLSYSVQNTEIVFEKVIWLK